MPEKPKPKDFEIIVTPVTNLPQAFKLIIGSARYRLVDLPWNKLPFHELHLDEGKLIGLFNRTYPSLFERFTLDLPLKVIDAYKAKDFDIFDTQGFIERISLSEPGLYLLLTREIPGKEATFIRDLLLVR